MNTEDKPTQNYGALRQIGGLLDGYLHHSNGVPRGQNPVLIESSETLSDAGQLFGDIRRNSNKNIKKAGRGAQGTREQIGSDEAYVSTVTPRAGA